MDKKSSKTSRFAACVLCFVNLLAMTICLLLIAVGLWVISSPTSLSTVIEFTGNKLLKALFHDSLTLSMGIGLTAVATLILFVSFMGFYGGVTRSPFLLFMYSALVLLLLLLECSLLYYFSSNLVEKGLQNDGLWTHAMRVAFQCCEHNTTVPEVRKRPWSCCGAVSYPDNCTATDSYKQDCHTSIVHLLERYQLPIYTSLAVFHLILASCSIIRRSNAASRSDS